MKITPKDLDELGIVDGIVSEPGGGAHRAPQKAAEELTTVLEGALEELEKLDPDTLVTQRIEKYASIGTFSE